MGDISIADILVAKCDLPSVAGRRPCAWPNSNDLGSASASPCMPSRDNGVSGETNPFVRRGSLLEFRGGVTAVFSPELIEIPPSLAGYASFAWDSGDGSLSPLEETENEQDDEIAACKPGPLEAGDDECTGEADGD